jgi:predicted SAM-dependent methyltransferase
MDLSEVSQNINRHPWEMSRADFLMSTIDGHAQLGQQSELLDVGAGDLFFSQRIHDRTRVRIDAVDSAFDDLESRNEAIRKIKHLHSVLNKRYDAICAMDVLEHVENDHEFMNLLLSLLKPGATLMITVPAYQFLFSQHDTNLRHFRRYRIGQVESLIDHRERYEIREKFYFFHSLFYVRCLEKFLQLFRKKQPEGIKSINHWNFTEHHPITRSLGTVLGLDAFTCRLLSRIGIRLPGLSLCLVIRKKS